jgi:dTDP-glucose 4,6-dehydratase
VKVVVFGGSGFVGRFLCERLAESGIAVLNCDLVAPTNTDTGIQFFRVDIATKAEVSKVPIDEHDIVVDLAANQYHGAVPKFRRERFFQAVNLGGLQNILERMREVRCSKLVFFSTDMVYGRPRYLPVDVLHAKEPFGPYGRSKRDAEAICYDFRKLGINITIFRPRMIVGPGRLGILGKLFSLVDRGLPVPTIGSGKNCYQMISVFDCVSAIEGAISAGCPDSEFNLGSLAPPATRDLLENLIMAVGSHSRVISTPAWLVKFALAFLGKVGLEIMYREQYMIADLDYVLDISKAEKELGWIPKYSDSDMVVAAYHEYRKSLQ